MSSGIRFFCITLYIKLATFRLGLSAISHKHWDRSRPILLIRIPLQQMHHPTTTFFTTEDKKRHPYLSSVLEPNTQKVIATAAVRVYYAPFINPHLNWSFSKLKGILVFGRNREGLVPPLGVSAPQASAHPAHSDRAATIKAYGPRLKERYWFRLIDIKTDSVVWVFPIPEVFEYHKDKPFFQYFSGTTRMLGFCFEEDEEADIFFRKVIDRTRRHFFGVLRSRSDSIKKAKPQNPFKPSKFKSLTSRQAPMRPSTATTIKPSMISSPTPNSFVHISHVGLSSTGLVESGPEPAWNALLEDLHDYGFESEGEVVSEVGHGQTDGNGCASVDFMEGFLAGAKAVRSRLTHPPRPPALPSSPKIRPQSPTAFPSGTSTSAAAASGPAGVTTSAPAPPRTSSPVQTHAPSVPSARTLSSAHAPVSFPAPSRAFSPLHAPVSPPASTRVFSPVQTSTSLHVPASSASTLRFIPAAFPVRAASPSDPILRSPSPLPGPGSPPPEKKRRIRRRVLLL